MVHNRKRQGEVSRLLVRDLNETCIYSLDDSDIGANMNLSEDAKKKAQEFVRVSIVNKRGLRNVGLLIHKNVLEGINLLLKYRTEAGIKADNKYIFATRSKDEYVDRYYMACNIIRDYAYSCGCQFPERINGTNMRKHMATKMYESDIPEQELSDLARFLGHELSIHKQYYRRVIPIRDLITLTPLLEKARGVNEDQSEEETEASSTVVDNSQVTTDESQYLPEADTHKSKF